MIVELVAVDAPGLHVGRVGVYAAATVAMLVLMAAARLYGRDEIRAGHATPDDLAPLFQATTTGAFAGCAAAWAYGGDSLVGEIALAWLSLLVLLPAFRSISRSIARRRGHYGQRTLILGAGDIGQLVARKLQQHPEYGLELIGFLDDHPRERAPDVADVPVVGGFDDVARATLALGVERVIVAFAGVPHTEILDVVRALKRLEVQVDIVPRLFEVVGPNAGVTTIEGLPLVELPPLRLSRANLAVKRAMDLTLAGAALLVTAPLFVLIAVAIRLEGRGPLVFAGERIGAGGRRFQQLKFRTMRPEFCTGSRFGGVAADEAFERLLADEPRLADEFRRTQKLEHDPRVTRVGRWLRRSSLDELPQLWNVLCGDLSLVGPRPITEQELLQRYRPRAGRGGEASFVMGYWDSRGLRPGLTGYWQISGRSRMSFDERIRLDTAYLTSWSLRLDLEILAKTFRALLPSQGAY